MKKAKLSAKNTKFWALGKARKRVAIAKDVLKWIEDKKFRPRSGDYLEGTFSSNKNDSLDITLNNTFCTACALGACFIGMVDLGDKIKVGDVFEGNLSTYNTVNVTSMINHLKVIFTGLQMDLIEAAFEKSAGMSRKTDKDHPLMHASIAFGKRFSSDTDTMVAIMKNIVKNKGSFMPNNS